jgi:hypothetical protein
LGSESDVLVSARVERYRGDAELRRAAEALYGMEFEIFVEEILAPQAEKDILAGRLYLQGKEFSDWLAEAKRSARVVLALEGFRWTGERVEWAD